MRNAKKAAGIGMIIVIAKRIMLERTDFVCGQLTDALDFVMTMKNVGRRREKSFACAWPALRVRLDLVMRERKEKSATAERNV